MYIHVHLANLTHTIFPKVVNKVRHYYHYYNITQMPLQMYKIANKPCVHFRQGLREKQIITK